MLFKNNKKMQLSREAERRSRFSIRKLNVGAASVMIGCFLYLGAGNVNAQVLDTQTPADHTENVENTQDKDTETDTKAEIKTPAEQVKANSTEHESVASSKPDSEQNKTEEEKKDTEETKTQVSSDLQKIEDQVKKYHQGDDIFLDPEYAKKASLMPQVAVQGEVPSLDNHAVWNSSMQYALNNLGVQTSADDPASYKLSWKVAPDVSKLGQTTGTVTVEAVMDYDKDGNPIYHSFDVDVPVEVVAGQKKTDGEVRNTLNFIDSDTNEVRYHYTWTGKKGTDQQDPDNAVLPIAENGELDKIMNSVEGLGYNLDEGETHNAINDVSYFMDHDIVRDIQITAASKDENGKPKVIVEDPTNPLPDADYTLQGSAYDYFSDPANQDPAEFLYGLGYLDPTDNVIWGTKPVYKSFFDKTTGNYDHGELLNDPTIEIVDKDGNVLQTFSGESLKNTLLRNYDNFNQGVFQGSPTVKGKVTIQEGEAIPSAASVVTNLPNADPQNLVPTSKDLQEKLNKYFNINWRIAPNVNQLGYQIAYIKFSLKPGWDRAEQTEAKNTLMAFFDASDSGIDENFDPNGIVANPYAVLVQVVPAPVDNTPQQSQPTEPQPTDPAPTQPTEAQPVKPETPEAPETPAKPDNVAPKAQDNEETKVNKSHKKQEKAVSTGNVKKEANKATVKAAEKAALPQTGNKKSAAAVIGLGLVAVAGLIALAGDRKRN